MRRTGITGREMESETKIGLDIWRRVFGGSMRGSLDNGDR